MGVTVEPVPDEGVCFWYWRNLVRVNRCSQAWAITNIVKTHIHTFFTKRNLYRTRQEETGG